ncbi:chorismate synthase [Candidatus Magnetominusculus dajiuhuensis]|uniref:chorismate synthase n=1 Tax=Candidatus Magnetominusculus dajiuhuensis TaxID=3137712 RepID=UPI003B434008
MSGIKIITAGESHGQALVGIVEGLPSNMPLSQDDIDKELMRRQMGYGRGGRMAIETDKAEILTGVRWGKTLGSPIAIEISNRDSANWVKGMSISSEHEGAIAAVTRPRPGHADLAGAAKYGFKDIRNILERASARETTTRVALGAVCKRFLQEFEIFIGSFVTSIGDVQSSAQPQVAESGELIELFKMAEADVSKGDNRTVRTPYSLDSEKMISAIGDAMAAGDTLGGTFVVFAANVPVGLGSHIQWDKKLDGRLAQAIMSIQAVKGVELGMGFNAATLNGSQVMDEIFYDKPKTPHFGFYRKTNNMGGIEGGMSNGMPIVLRAAMKPIPTLRKKPLKSVDLLTKSAIEAAYERSDVCAVPSCSVIAEAMMAVVLADAFLDKFGGDAIDETKANYYNYMKYLSGI